MIDHCADCGASIHDGDRIVYRPSLEMRDAFITTCGACDQKEGRGKWRPPWKKPRKRCYWCGKKIQYRKDRTAWFCALETHPELHVQTCDACARKIAAADDEDD